MCEGKRFDKGVKGVGAVAPGSAMLQLGMSRRLKDGRYWIQAIIRFYNAATDEEKLTAAASPYEILRQIDEGWRVEVGVFC